MTHPDLECPTCGAEPGAPCTTSTGHTATKPHVARIDAAGFTERNESEMSKHDGQVKDLALTPERAAAEHFDEEMTLLQITLNRIFRTAIEQGDPPLPEPPELAVEFEDDELADALADLDEARDSEDAVSHELAKWKMELAAS